MLDSFSIGLIGLTTGLFLGVAARAGRFCSLGAVEDILYGKRYYRSLMWVSAIGYSLIGMGALLSLGWFELESALYMRFEPNYLAHIVGGLLFGYGMALAGMCGFTGLARIGTGDMRALFVVIIIGIASYVASSGWLAPLRQLLFSYAPLSSSDLPSYASLAGQPEWVFLGLGFLLATSPLLRHNYRRSSYPYWSLLMAFGIVGGWAGTYWVSQQSFEPIMVSSHTFSLPLGDTILFAMLSSVRDFSFGVGSVFGVILGAFLASLWKREFIWEACDDPRELRRQLAGAILMGIGAVLAFGCSVGQGLSAMAVLSFGAPVTLLSIVLGAYLGLKLLIEGR